MAIQKGHFVYPIQPQRRGSNYQRHQLRRLRRCLCNSHAHISQIHRALPVTTEFPHTSLTRDMALAGQDNMPLTTHACPMLTPPRLCASPLLPNHPRHILTDPEPTADNPIIVVIGRPPILPHTQAPTAERPPKPEYSKPRIRVAHHTIHGLPADSHLPRLPRMNDADPHLQRCAARALRRTQAFTPTRQRTPHPNLRFNNGTSRPSPPRITDNMVDHAGHPIPHRNQGPH